MTARLNMKSAMNVNRSAESSLKKQFAGIEYVGISGGSKDCKDAVLRFIHYGDRITHARILSSSRDHALLLTINVGDLVAVIRVCIRVRGRCGSREDRNQSTRRKLFSTAFHGDGLLTWNDGDDNERVAK